MRLSRATIGLLAVLAVAVGGTLFVLGVLGPHEPQPSIGGADGSTEAAEETGARLVGAPNATNESEIRGASLDDLLFQMKESIFAGEDDLALQAELRRRGESDAALVGRLLQLLRLRDFELLNRGYPRVAVLQALVALGRVAALPLAEFALSPEGGGPYPDHLWTLGEMGPEAAPAVGLLLEHYASVEDATEQEALLAVFGAIGKAAEGITPRLEEILSPPVDDRLAGTAARALVSIKGPTPEVFEVIRASLLDDETLARPGILSSLWELGGDAAPLKALLVDLLEDDERITATSAANLLGEIGEADPKVIRALAHMLDDGTSGEQWMAASALVKLGERGHAALLALARTSEDVHVRLRAVAVLQGTDISTEARLEPLLTILDEDWERDWKRSALLHIAQLDPPPDAELVMPALMRYLDDPRLRTSAIRVLGSLQSEDARAILRDLTREADSHETRLEVANTLRGIGDDSIRIDALLQVLQSPAATPDERQRALRLITRFWPRAKASEVLSTLRSFLEHEDDFTRRVAHQALSSLEGEDAEVVRLLVTGLEKHAYVGECGFGLQRRPAYASKSIPAIIDACTSGKAAGAWTWYVGYALKTLSPAWSGTASYFDKRIAEADGETKTTLEWLRKRALGK